VVGEGGKACDGLDKSVPINPLVGSYLSPLTVVRLLLAAVEEEANTKPFEKPH